MIKYTDTIMKNLNILNEVKSKGIDLKHMTNITKENMQNISFLDKDIKDMNGIQRYIFYVDKEIIDILNSGDEVLKKAYNCIAESSINIKDNINRYDKVLLKKLYEQYEKRKLNFKKSKGYYSYSYCNNIKDIMVFVLNFSLIYEYDIEDYIKIYNRLDVFAQNYNSYNDFLRMPEIKKYDFLQFLNNDCLKYFLRGQWLSLFQSGNNEILKLMEYLSSKELWISHKFYETNTNSNINSDNILNNIIEIEKILSEEEFNNNIQVIIEQPLCEKEIRIYLDKLRYGHKNAFKSFDSHCDYLKYIYNLDDDMVDVLNNVGSVKYNFIRYALKNKKRAFLRLMLNNKEVFLNLSDNCSLFSKNFLKMININTLNKDNLQDLSEFSMLYNFDKFDSVIKKNKTLTFNEFKELYTKSDTDIEIYLKLNLKVDEKLKRFREIPSINTLYNLVSEEEKINRITNALNKQSLSSFIESESSKIGIINIDKVEWFNLFVYFDIYKKYIKQIETKNDIEFIGKIYNTNYYKLNNLLDIKRVYYKEDEVLNKVLDDILELSNDFKKDNEKQIFDFAERNLHTIVDTYYRRLNSERQNNLKLITKAHLAGQLEKIKFFNDDLDIEIGMKTNNETKNAWKHNKISKYNNFTIEETYDFETTIRIGEVPTKTCMHWDRGSYNSCLLSLFDTNKKILVIKDKDNQIVGRAIIRLTKTSSAPFTEESIFGFKDIEKLNISKKETKENNTERLTLFLEKPYLKHLNDRECTNILTCMIKLMNEKAKELGAILAVSPHYDYIIRNQEFNNNPCKKNLFMLISFSKNGKQYLDSLGGENETYNEGKFKNTQLYVFE